MLACQQFLRNSCCTETDVVHLLDIVLQAGGLTEFAAPSKARLYRTVEGRTKIYPIDLDAILKQGDLSTNYPLYPSDVVTVPERSF